MYIVNNNEPLLSLPKSRTLIDRVFFVLNIIGCFLASFILFVGIWWYKSVKWGAETWSDLKLTELMYTLFMPMNGVDHDMVSDHIAQCVVPALIPAIIFAVVLIILFRKKTVIHIFEIAAVLIAATFGVMGLRNAWDVLDLSSFMSGQQEYGSFIDENYVDPATVKLEFPEQKRNLVYIFLESVENTFADQSVGGAFDKNVMPELTKLSLENENFSGGNEKLNGGIPMTGATWTMGAMFSQTSGIPLLIQVGQNSMSLQEDFFPGVTGIGDILEEEGYNQTLLVGSDVTLGGRDLYFAQHGNYKLKDYYYYIDQGIIPSDYFVWWGYEDKYLFANAKAELQELASKDQPFNLTMLTVDTHFEDGYMCSFCREDFDNHYSNVYSCSSRQVDEFVNWIKQQDFYENTTIVIAGDHKTMDVDYCENVSKEYERTAYFTIINGAAERETEGSRLFTTFDNFPTTLASLGVEIPGDRLGLGVNLYSDVPTLIEVYGKKMFEQGLNEKSKVMEELTADIITKVADIKISELDKDTNSVTISASDVRLPANVEGVDVNIYPKSDKTAARRYRMDDLGDHKYSFVLYLDEFDSMPGEYQVNMIAKGYRMDTFIAGTTMVIGDPRTGGGVHAEAAKTELYIGELDYATGNATVQLFNAPNDAVAVNVAVWTKGDQSDLRWYDMLPNGDGTYSRDIPVTDFGCAGTEYFFDVYETNFNGENMLLNTYSQKVG